ncbi:MAG: VCBS repeat-containing protein, partial [Planctomycetes bacterium]|nr:VCBS repeat-containing protein [Planctomycetota bacterium]
MIEGLEPRFTLSAAPATLALPLGEPLLEAASLVSLRPPIDLNGDAIVDAVWRNATTGINVAWIYDTAGVVTSTRVLGGDASWTIEAVGDFNGDAVSDIAWRNLAGTVVLRLMAADGATLQASVLGGDATWRLEACGDYDGNLKTDLIWRNATTGGDVMWLMNGTSVTSARLIGGDATWRLESTAADFDANADGMTDLVLKQANAKRPFLPLWHDPRAQTFPFRRRECRLRGSGCRKSH